MQDLSSGILLKDAYPTSDSTGLKNDAYKFKIVNNSNSKITYQIVFQTSHSFSYPYEWHQNVGKGQYRYCEQNTRNTIKAPYHTPF